MLKKVVVIGPESTGKSTLCAQLASYYQTLWCPEYAREYLLKHGKNYTYDDLLTIAKGQIELEEKCIQLLVGSSESGVRALHLTENSELMIRSSKLLFIDTNMYVMKVWCEFVFGKCHKFILDQIAVRDYHLYLLCNIDLPWTHDDLREYPDIGRRQRLYAMYHEIMTSQPINWVGISGDTETRLRSAIEAVDSLLKE